MDFKLSDSQRQYVEAVKVPLIFHSLIVVAARAHGV
jgi:hypothetical protein